jgi:hypothetical protein
LGDQNQKGMSILPSPDRASAPTPHLAGRAHTEQERIGCEPAARGLQLGHIELRIKHLFHVFLPIWTMPEVGIAQITL